MLGLGMQELIIILVIVLVLFGAKRLPELASGMGKAIKNFKKATSEPDEIDVTPQQKNVSEKKEETAEGKDSKQ
ncbi:MAG: twin-arginine translocase TatA/TatE family subunit [Nitrospirota bacterium]